MVPRRILLALAIVVDVALHARGQPVAAKALAERHHLTPRHLEPLLQRLVRTGVLKGTRGPRGGYELARERRRISAGEIMRVLLKDAEESQPPPRTSGLLEDVIAPALAGATESFLNRLDELTVEDLCRRAGDKRILSASATTDEFHI
ncbi:RrF2 family transcriptional regulator [Lichenifustis flavocetrariae]|uniref:Rrf2 family transcriptional regulator n=1 Tax=Lichenifustis flavocetrariae TaxID=2949735 RepID=A0AA42CMH9_9HYPH|nr:Rrf2 family transcriptional regulator [Lichenifustis flavocetrariae]MCW6508402.1 Rrf2 family transcriptional regulator [Lichenifustis flavocetrariae]